jgi:DNA-binding LacI/PurR family transcriptional regulator
LATHGIAVDESLIAYCPETDALSGYFAAKALLKQSNPPTGIVVARDCIAEGVCRGVEEMGLELGRDVSVIGFDDITWPGGRDFLTTFREPCYEMGQAAAEMLVNRIIDPNRTPETRVFDTPLVLRRTAGPVKQTKRFFSNSKTV